MIVFIKKRQKYIKNITLLHTNITQITIGKETMTKTYEIAKNSLVTDLFSSFLSVLCGFLGLNYGICQPVFIFNWLYYS